MNLSAHRDAAAARARDISILSLSTPLRVRTDTRVYVCFTLAEGVSPRTSYDRGYRDLRFLRAGAPRIISDGVTCSARVIHVLCAREP